MAEDMGERQPIDAHQGAEAQKVSRRGFISRFVPNRTRSGIIGNESTRLPQLATTVGPAFTPSTPHSSDNLIYSAQRGGESAFQAPNSLKDAARQSGTLQEATPASGPKSYSGEQGQSSEAGGRGPRGFKRRDVLKAALVVGAGVGIAGAELQIKPARRLFSWATGGGGGKGEGGAQQGQSPDGTATPAHKGVAQMVSSDGTTVPDATPSATSVKENPSARELHTPGEIKEIPQDLVDALHKEDGPNAQILHLYQGEHFKFAFAIDDRLPTRTTATTDFGNVKNGGGEVTTISDVDISSNAYDKFTGTPMSEAEKITRMENVLILKMIALYRNDDSYKSLSDPNHKSLFTDFDAVNDPYDLKAIEQFKRHYRDGTLKAEKISGAFIDPEQTQVIKLENNNLSTKHVNGLGYEDKYFFDGPLKGGHEFKYWIQYVQDEASVMQNYQNQVATGRYTQAQVDAAIASGYSYATAFPRNFVSTITIASHPGLKSLYESGHVAKLEDVQHLWEPYYNQLYPVRKGETQVVSILHIKN